jgi:hypothetical protein
MADGVALDPVLAARMLAAIRWVEQQPEGVRRTRTGIPPADPFERCKLSAQLSKGSSATADLYSGSASTGWTITTNEITVHEDDMLAAGESIASGVDIIVMWMHGDWVFFDVPCADIDS